MDARAAKALDLALLPLTLAWWTGTYGLGLGMPRGASGGSPRKIPARPFEGLDEAVAGGRPVILTGVDRAWSAIATWTPPFLAERLGPTPVEVVTLVDGARDFLDGYYLAERSSMPFRDLAARVFDHPEPGRRSYMMGGNWTMLGTLGEDVPAPREIDGRRFFPEGSGLWVGQRGNVTALHYDFWHGFLAQVAGRKRVSLFAPDESARVYPDSPFSSRIGATRLPTMFLEADPASFPKLSRATRHEAVLGPGDLLYVPPFWWHHVESLDDAISLSLRYEPTWRESVRPGAFPVKYRRVLLPLARSIAGMLTGKTAETA
jgi:lysine-specific demethylase 8